MKSVTFGLNDVEQCALIAELRDNIAIVLLLKDVECFDDVAVSESGQCSFFIG